MGKPWKIGCIGAGGHALRVMGRFFDSVPPERALLTAVRSSNPAKAAENPVLAGRGIRFVDSVEELLSGCGLDAVFIPTSIDSHLEFTRRALEAGLHVLVEKPVAATVDEVDEMIALRNRSGLTVAVGYQANYAPATQWARQCIADGAIGPVRQARAIGLLPRRDSYYHRNAWAGKLRSGDGWILDSPANNALAHHVNLAFYLTGPGRFDTNQPVEVEAELYRGRAEIENFDTCAIRCQTAAGVPVLILLSHACATPHPTLVEIIGETGLIRRTEQACQLVRKGKVEAEKEYTRPVEKEMFENFFDRMEGRVGRVLCELENGRAQTLLINGAGECARVHKIPDTAVRRVVPEGAPEGDAACAIEGIHEAWKECFASFHLPSETGGVPWAREPGRMDLREYRSFLGVPA